MSRLDGVSSLKDICLMTGMSASSVSKILLKLNRLALVYWEGSPLPYSSMDLEEEREDVEPPPDVHSTDDRDIELDADTRNMINSKYWDIIGQDLYRVLEIRKNATKEEIRRAYRKLAALYHPDHFFRMNIGSYRPKLEEICRKLRVASELLGDDRARRIYNEKLKEARKTSIIRPNRTRRKKGGISAHPVAKKVKKAKRLYESAIEANRSGNIKEAYNAIKLALMNDPKKPEYKEFAAILEKEVNKGKAQSYYARAKNASIQGDMEQSLELLRHAAKLDPDSWQYSYELAGAIVDMGGDLEEAVRRAKRAVFLSGGNPDCRYFLAMLLEKTGRSGDAEMEYKKLVSKKQKVQEAKERLAIIGKGRK
ncbi:MAG: DnaJ domain-containing protein [Deltaproteobacteria bacterium]|nr:DnaJ domain-containing protein [Deltaproteobacteria bacterium]